MSAESILASLGKIKSVVSGTKLVEAFAEEGKEVANTAYAGMTTATRTESGYEVNDGTRGMIAEFGAGLDTEASHPFAADMGFPVYRGSYSDEHQGEYQATGYQYWHANGVEFKTVKPRRGMYLSMEHLQTHGEEIAKKVFDAK